MARDGGVLWRGDQLRSLEQALGRARGGRPTVLAVEGEAGAGKSALLRELRRGAGDFKVLVAEGVEGDGRPGGVLAQWGVPPGPPGLPVEAFPAAQALRRVLDALGGAPVLLVLDDLHWADPESVAALLWLLRRTDGDELLVATATRPLPAEAHPGWQRWIRGNDAVLPVVLDGLSVDQIARLAGHGGRVLPDGLAEKLREHTGGNPLYLGALLDEFPVEHLSARTLLPAPAHYAAAVHAHADRLPVAARALLEALAVLGGGWQPLLDAAAVVEVDDPVAAAGPAARAGLLELRSSAAGDTVRAGHALLRAALHDRMPLERRKALHLRAAALQADPGLAFDHRLAAASLYDEDLAAAVVEHAHTLRRNQAWSESARYLRGAAAITPDPARRRARTLESLLDLVAARDFDAAAAALTARPDRDEPTELVVRGLLAFHAGQEEALGLLGDAIAAARRVGDRLALYRALVTSALAQADLQGHAAHVGLLLAEARQLDVDDLCTAYYAAHAQASHDATVLSPGQQWARFARPLRPAAAVPIGESLMLCERALAAARCGLFEQAREDLVEVMRRVRTGALPLPTLDVPDSLGYVHWVLGEWDAARLMCRLTRDLGGVSQYLPLIMTGDGELPLRRPDPGPVRAGKPDQAERAARAARADLAVRELVDAWDRESSGQSPIIRLFALVEQARALDDHRVRAHIGRQYAPTVRGRVNSRVGEPMMAYFLHLGQVALWADDHETASTCAQALERAEPQAPWGPGGAAWLRGMSAHAVGDRGTALPLLDRAAEDRAFNLPFQHAHILVDAARTFAAADHPARAADLLARAEAIYRRLGALPYLGRTAAAPGADAGAGARAGAGSAAELPGNRIDLTDRERDVITLAVDGMSYAQIAADLFITRKTVGFHLSNVYAKAGVNTRHELAALARREPTALGLAPRLATA